jgi:hypothetical protein
MNELGLDRAAAEALRTAAPRARRFKADCWRLDAAGTRIVVKDYSRTNWLFRCTLGALQLRREERAYRRLDGLPFVPRCYGRLDADALLIEHKDGVPMLGEAPKRMAPDFFVQLRAAIAAMHARGILHNDLRHRRNILVGDDGGPRLVDFASALDVGVRGAQRRLFGWLALLDRSAVLKWSLRHAPEQVSDGDRAWYQRFLWFRRMWPFGQHRFARQLPPPAGTVPPMRADPKPLARCPGARPFETAFRGDGHRIG